MSELVVFGFLALSILAYGVTGGADFGVGILESLAPRAERSRIRSLGEHAIASQARAAAGCDRDWRRWPRPDRWTAPSSHAPLTARTQARARMTASAFCSS